MNLILSSDDEKLSSDNGRIDNFPADKVATVTSDKHAIASSLTGDLLATDSDADSIAEVEDGLSQLNRQQVDKVPSDTSDSVLSTSDTLSSYSGCSVCGVGEPFVAVFGGVQEHEVSQDDVWNEVNNSNDDDSAVHVCSVDGSLCESVASSQDHGDESNSGVNVTLTDDTCAQKVESSSFSWYGTNI